ncbi:MAG: hypothetical protein A2Z20_07665 [Bdellovibrionales bacterium RBG_16_40_8]|nr:MAG: hypothetical protein A2Z20_07665 [Bdellovibrionales bacterium RBG_16_40_8]
MKKIIVLSLAILTLGACSKQHHNSGGLTHSEVAAMFVSDLNATGLYNVSIAKTYTEQAGYIVIYDYDLNEYDAVEISYFDPYYDNAATFLEYDTGSIYDLTPLYGNRYYDWYTGLTFEKVQSTSKDLEKYAALAQEKVIKSRAENVAAKFGLSVERSKDVVRLAMAWQKSGGKELAAKDQDSFSKELLGFSISDAKKAVTEKESGNSRPLDSLIEKAALTNETTPENVRQIIDQYFTK